MEADEFCQPLASYMSWMLRQQDLPAKFPDSYPKIWVYFHWPVEFPTGQDAERPITSQCVDDKGGISIWRKWEYKRLFKVNLHGFLYYTAERFNLLLEMTPSASPSTQGSANEVNANKQLNLSAVWNEDEWKCIFSVVSKPLSVLLPPLCQFPAESF